MSNAFSTIRYYIFILLTFISTTAAGKNTLDNNYFRPLSTFHNFNESTILRLHQDQQGFVWLGTPDGLYKYDGNDCKKVSENIFNEDVKNFIFSEDKSNKTLWFLANDSIYYLQMETDRIENSHIDVKQISDIHIDDNHLLWIATKNNGIYHANTADMTVRHWVPDPAFQNIKIQRFRKDKKGDFYFLTHQNGVYKYETRKKEIISYCDSLPGATTLFVDSRNTLWIGTWHGLFYRDEQNKSYQYLKLADTDRNSLFAITDIVEKVPGILYISTDRGLYTYNTNNQEKEFYESDYSKEGYISARYINDLLFDRDSTLWIATYFGGISLQSKTDQKFWTYRIQNNQMNGHVISAFAEDDNNHLWIATEDGGISYLNTLTHTLKNFNSKDTKVPFPRYYNIHSLLLDGNQLYVGMTNTGIDIYNVTTRKVTSLTSKGKSNALSSNTIFSLFKYDNEHIYIGSIKGLDIYNPLTGTVTKVTDIPNLTVNCILRDTNGGLWCCGTKLGVYHRPVNGKWEKISKKDISCDLVKTMTQQGDSIFFGTQGEGLYVFDLNRHTFHQLHDTQIQDKNITNLISERNRLWVCTDHHIYCYNLQTREIRQLTYHDNGQQRAFRPNANIITKKGVVLLGSTKGFCGFHPHLQKASTLPPTTRFTELKINNEMITPDTKNSPIKNILPYTEEITLSHGQSNLSLQFSSLSTPNNIFKKYRYKLYPVSNKWTYTSSNTINLPHLSSGLYALTVCSSNNEGVWDENGHTLKIRILPPWWLSAPMFAVYILAFISGLLYYAHRLKRKQNRRIEEIKIKKEKELYRSKIEFFTNLVHDIRTPLTLIVSPLHALLQRDEAQSLRYELDIIERNSQRLLKQVNQLMDFQKSEMSQKATSRFEPLDVVAEINQIFQDFELEARNKGIILHLDTEETAQATIINGSHDLFAKIFFNLLSNALKFTQTTINIHIKCLHEQCAIAIQDDGIGIPENMQKVIFEPFVQIKEQLPKDYIGTGIGLSIVKNIVKDMNGHINVDSKPGEGTTFTVYFPILHNITSDTTQKEKAATHDTHINEDQTECAQKGIWSIAIVEDNNDMRSFVSSILQGLYSVHSYSNGKELLNDITSIQFDLIISDIMMPGIDGYTLCKKIKDNAETKHIPIILLTAKIQEEDEIEGLDSGADAYIRKPFSVELLRSRIKNLIENRERLFKEFKQNPQKQLVDIVEDESNKEFVGKLNKIVYQNLKNPQLNAQYVASELCICRTLFFSKIKAFTGMTFVDYVRIARLKCAVELLMANKYTITEVAEETGYSSVSYFYRLFKKQYGKTPAEFLKENKLTENSPQQ